MDVSNVSLRELINNFAVPILLIQGNPRQVVTANQKACEFFGKDLSDIEGFRSGDIFRCINATAGAGCGLDDNCRDCKIQQAVIDTLESGTTHNDVITLLNIEKQGKTVPYELQLSTAKKGDFVLMAINRFTRKR